MPTSSLRRLQRALGLLLTAVVLLHLWEQSPIRGGRTGVLERLFARFEGVPVWLEGVLLWGALLTYAALAVWSLWRAHGGADGLAADGPGGERARNARLAALAFSVFALWHVATLWVPARALGGGALQAMALAEAQLDQLGSALAYVLGWSAFCVSFGYALSGEAPGGRGWVLLGFGASVGLWLWGIDLLAAYVAGASLL